MASNNLDYSPVRRTACLALLLASCSSSGDPGADASSSGGASTSGASTGPTTSSEPTGGPTTTSTSGESATGSTTEPTSTSTTAATSTTDTTQGVDSLTTGSDTTDGTTTVGTTTGDPDTTGTTGDPDTTGTTGEPGTTTGTTGAVDNCVPTEMVEVTCDLIDNDCDDSIDNVDVGKDGICDCLTIGILGGSGFAPSANFEAWLESQGSAVTRTLLANNPGVVTPMLLAQYDLILIDRIERPLAPAEAAAIEAFVKDDGRGMITLIDYNFDNNNPVPERDRANTALAPFGLAYEGGYFADGLIPTFDQGHPIGMGIADVNFAGGIEPADIGNQGTSEVFATVANGDAGIAHQTAMEGGRVIVWGDEWITFDSDWVGYADVQDLWVNMVSWAKPKDFCGAPQ